MRLVLVIKVFLFVSFSLLSFTYVNLQKIIGQNRDKYTLADVAHVADFMFKQNIPQTHSNPKARK